MGVGRFRCERTEPFVPYKTGRACLLDGDFDLGELGKALYAERVGVEGVSLVS